MRIQKIGFRSALLAASATCTLLVPWAATQAQIAADANAAPAPEEKLEEITVTARRRAENLQTVPIAVTVVSQSKLEENNVTSLLQLQYLVPSMSGYAVAYRDIPTFSIRGLGASIGGGGAPAVVTYLNEIPIAAPASDLTGAVGGLNGPGLLFDLENVQVLKGPQGTNFGQNAVGGAVLLQTARPKDDLEARLQTGYGNYNHREVDAMINVPLIQDELLFRIAYNGGWRDGFTHLMSTPDHSGGVDADDLNFSSVRGSVTFKPNGAFQNDTIVTYSKYQDNGSPRFVTAINPTGSAAKLFPGITAVLAQQEALGTLTHIPIDTVSVSSGTTLALGNISTVDVTDHLRFRNILGYNDQKTTASSDSDGTMFPVVEHTPQVAIGRQYTEEAQLQGSKTLGGTLDWTLGLFYLDQPRGPFSAVTSTTYGKKSDSKSSIGATSKAVYGLANYDLSAILPQLNATAGVRYTRDSHSAEVHGGPLNNFANPVRADVTNTAVTWNAGLNYQVVQDTMVYTSVSRGYRSGGNNTAQPNLPGFGPEFVTNYEIGTKSDWRIASVPVRTNAALFYENYTNLQLSDFTLINGTFQSITANGGSARLWGAEFEVSAQLTQRLQMGVNFDYLNFDFTQFAAGVNVAATELFAKDNRPPYKYGVNARYQLPVPSQIGSVSVQANWAWQDTSGDANLVIGGLIPPYGLLNMTADWNGIGGGPLDAQLYVSNALNKVYVTGGLGGYNLTGFDSYRYGEPRMYGVRLRYQFK
jgi:iron complex outermembrane receptor protein